MEAQDVNKREMLDAYKVKGEAVLPTGATVTRSTSLRIR